MRPFLLIAASLLALTAAPARAEVRAREQFLSLGLGGAYPFTSRATIDTMHNVDLNENRLRDEIQPKEAIGGAGFSGFLQYTYHFVDYVGVGFEVQGAQFSVARHRPLGLTRQGVVKTDGGVIQGLAIARWVFRPSRKINPYLLTGVGFGGTSARVRFTPDGSNPWNSGTTEERLLYKRMSSGMAVAIAPGVQMQVGDKFLFGAEGRWAYNEVEINVLGSNNLETVRGFLWAGFKFGGDYLDYP